MANKNNEFNYEDYMNYINQYVGSSKHGNYVASGGQLFGASLGIMGNAALTGGLSLFGDIPNLANRGKKQTKIFNKNIDELAYETMKKGSKLSKSEIKDIIGASNYKWWRDDYFDDIYNEWYSQNREYLVGKYAEDYKQWQKQQEVSSDVSALQNAFAELGIGAPEQLNVNGLNANYQNYLDQLNALSDSQYAVAMDELQRSENEMYRAIGMSQRQMERDIAKRRQQALKSGMSTAQLAAQEQQNLLAAQTGATMLAQNYTNQRYNTINQFATARQQNLTDVLGQQINYSNTRQQNWDSTLANMYAQIYAADKYQK